LLHVPSTAPSSNRYLVARSCQVNTLASSTYRRYTSHIWDYTRFSGLVSLPRFLYPLPSAIWPGNFNVDYRLRCVAGWYR
jgi:hypothetical protein